MAQKVTYRTPDLLTASNRTHWLRLHRGFTIVELVIIIVVIAILAAITIVAYNGITAQSLETSMMSDLKNASSTLEVDRNRAGSYPSSVNDANGGDGLESSGDNILSYSRTSNDYCLMVTNSRVGKTFMIKNGTNAIEEGECLPASPSQ